MMPIRLCALTLHLILLTTFLSWMAGCSVVDQYTSVPPLQLNDTEEALVGAAVEKELLQMLGGPYHDRELADDITRLAQSNSPCTISIADRSTVALFPLPGCRAVVTQGLLGELKNQSELPPLFERIVLLSRGIYDDRVTGDMAKLTNELLSESGSANQIDSAAIRLARYFKNKPCMNDCLDAISTAANQAASNTLTDSVKRISSLKKGNKLADSARHAEQSGDQEKAIALYLQAAATAPGEPRILGALGLAYLRFGEIQQARIHLQSAVKLQPNYYRTQMGLGYIYLQQGDHREAERALTKSTELFLCQENIFLLAETWEKIGDLKEAESMYRQVMAFDQSSKLGRSAANRLEQLAGVQ